MSPGRRSEEGQTLAEYSILVAGIAVACAFVLLFLSGGIGGFFGSTTKPLTPGGPLLPPNPAVIRPTSDADCADGGWKTLNYSNKEACENAVPHNP